VVGGEGGLEEGSLVKPQKIKGSQALAPPESVKPGQTRSKQGVLEIMKSIFATLRRDKSASAALRRDKSVFVTLRRDKSVFAALRRDKDDCAPEEVEEDWDV